MGAALSGDRGPSSHLGAFTVSGLKSPGRAQGRGVRSLCPECLFRLAASLGHGRSHPAGARPSLNTPPRAPCWAAGNGGGHVGLSPPRPGPPWGTADLPRPCAQRPPRAHFLNSLCSIPFSSRAKKPWDFQCLRNSGLSGEGARRWGRAMGRSAEAPPGRASHNSGQSRAAARPPPAPTGHQVPRAGQCLS